MQSSWKFGTLYQVESEIKKADQKFKFSSSRSWMDAISDNIVLWNFVWRYKIWQLWVTVKCHKCQTLKIQPSSWELLSSCISVKYNLIFMKFCMLQQKRTRTKLMSTKFNLINYRTGVILENTFLIVWFALTFAQICKIWSQWQSKIKNIKFC